MVFQVGFASASYAFSSPTCLPLNFDRTVASRACICMKTKRGGAAKEKRVAKGKRPSSSGAGFASKSKKGEKTTEAVDTKATKSQDETSAESPEGQVEQVSGASGDATPHRVQVKGPTTEELENPEKDPLDAPETPLVELPSLTPERRAELRIPYDESLDSIVERFADAHGTDDFGPLVIANRDFVTEALLYRFTSAILQVEARRTALETKEEESRNMRALRKDIIAYCWSHDYPLKVELQNAEARLLVVLQGTNVKKDVSRNCGTTPLEVNAFWIVLYAAIAAWEERGRENPQLANVDMQTALGEAAEASTKVKEFSTLLSPALQAVQTILSATDPEVQATVVSQLDEESIIELGSLTEQVRLFPSAAYGALCNSMAKILRYILNVRYEAPANILEPVRFALAPLQTTSKLGEFTKRSRSLQRTS